MLVIPTLTLLLDILLNFAGCIVILFLFGCFAELWSRIFD